MHNSNGRKYFGTDGIRGRVGEQPITAEFCLRLGLGRSARCSPPGGRASC